VRRGCTRSRRRHCGRIQAPRIARVRALGSCSGKLIADATLWDWAYPKTSKFVVTLDCVEGHDVQPRSGGSWRRPPWSTPGGRRPRYRQVLRTGLGVDALYTAAFSGMYLTNARTSWTLDDLRPFSIFFVGIASLGFAYGIAVMLTAGRQRGVMPAWLGLNVNPEARAWFGLAIVIPLVIGGVGAFFVWPPGFQTTDRYQLMFTIFFFAPAVVAAGCVLRSRMCSYRDAKEAIVSGAAPSYVMSHDRIWWWDGAQWASTAAAAPSQALRSPDGNYWWTGRDWCALPALPWRVSRASQAPPDPSARVAVS
jgi:hypothetical protein